MMMSQNNYRELIQGIRKRLDPENRVFTKSLNEDLSTISYAEVFEYVRYAMNAVDNEYTQKSKEAGDRVKKHLIDNGIDAEFKYQGSVMTDTHIKGLSDIDLLTISKDFYTCDSAAIKAVLNEPARRQEYLYEQIERLKKEEEISVYQGDTCNNLYGLRINSEEVLSKVYKTCDVSKPKSIKIRNLDLYRDVDIVIANWYDDLNSIISDRGNSRGIQVYNKHLNQRGKIDFPFISIDRINTKSAETGGRLKKMIRFLKNAKAKSSLSIGLTSFDFNAICYDIQKVKYQSLPYYDLVFVLFSQLKRIADDSEVSNSLKSVDGREYIFRGKPENLQSLKNIITEIEVIVTDLKTQSLLS